MTDTLSNKQIVDGKELLDFCVEFQGLFYRREYRSAVSETALRAEIDTNEPWRPPYTIARVKGWSELEACGESHE